MKKDAWPYECASDVEAVGEIYELQACAESAGEPVSAQAEVCQTHNMSQFDVL